MLLLPFVASLFLRSLLDVRFLVERVVLKHKEDKNTSEGSTNSCLKNKKLLKDTWTLRLNRTIWPATALLTLCH